MMTRTGSGEYINDHGHNHGHEIMRKIKASEFKATCLRLMDEVQRTGETIVVTKRGEPVCELVPHRRRPETLFGALAGSVEILGDIVAPVDVEWESAT